LDGSQRIGFEYRQVGIEQTLFQLGAFASAADIAATSGSGDRVRLEPAAGRSFEITLAARASGRTTWTSAISPVNLARTPP
jgi:hypothetical protein